MELKIHRFFDFLNPFVIFVFFVVSVFSVFSVHSVAQFKPPNGETEMQFANCRQCGLPRGTGEVDSQACPLCGFDPTAPEIETPPPVVVAPPVANTQPLSLASEEPKSHRSWLIPVLFVGFAAVGGVFLAIALSNNAEPQPDDNKPVAEVPPSDQEQPQKPKPLNSDDEQLQPKLQPEAAPDQPEIGPAPRLAVEMPPEPMPDPKQVVKEKEKEKDPPMLLGADVEEINKPDGEVEIGALDGEDARILRGEVKTLRITSVKGKASLDALKLKAKEIIITGAIEGEGRLRVYAPNGTVEIRGKVDGKGTTEIIAPGGKVTFSEPSQDGKDGSKIDGAGTVTVMAKEVEFRGKIDGGSRLNVHAPEGKVSFSQPTEPGKDGSRISGGAQVQITTKHAEFRGSLRGGAQIRVTLEKSGSLRLTEVDEGANVLYRKADPKDPEPTIERGEIKGGGQVREQPEDEPKPKE